jgi:hypothetical protein
MAVLAAAQVHLVEVQSAVLGPAAKATTAAHQLLQRRLLAVAVAALMPLAAQALDRNLVPVVLVSRQISQALVLLEVVAVVVVAQVGVLRQEQQQMVVALVALQVSQVTQVQLTPVVVAVVAVELPTEVPAVLALWSCVI